MKYGLWERMRLQNLLGILNGIGLFRDTLVGQNHKGLRSLSISGEIVGVS